MEQVQLLYLYSYNLINLSYQHLMYKTTSIAKTITNIHNGYLIWNEIQREKNKLTQFLHVIVHVKSKKHTLTHSWYTSNKPLHSSFVFPFRNFSENHLLKHASYFSLSSWHSGLMLFILSGWSSNISTRS